MKFLPILILLLLVQGCNDDGLEPGFPEDNYLLKIVQSWGSNSEFDLLSEKYLGKEDIELRFWSGFGTRGDHGVILKKTNTDWKAYSVEIRACLVLSHKEGVSDSLKRRVTIDKMYTDQINCGPESEVDLVDVIWQFTDSLFVTELQTDSNYNQLWKQLKKEGVLDLPSEVERTEYGIDGHSYVLELKIGEIYHAYVSEFAQPEYESDKQVHKIAQSIDKYLNTSLDGSKW